MEPAVSVVVSTFNRAAPLARALGRLCAQHVPAGLSYEVIVIDNNSTDETAAVVSSFVARTPGLVRCIFEPQQGVSHGRNAGIRAARAAIIAFTDDDNEADPEWVASVAAALDRRPDVAGVGGRVLPEWPRPAPKWLDRQHWSPLAILDYGDAEFDTGTEDPRCLLTANLAFRREVLERVGGFSADFARCQDHELLIRVWRAGARVLYDPSLIVRTRVPEERLTREYHRVWHTTHGLFSASMQLQESISASGALLRKPIDAIRLYGAPGFVYRELLAECRRWLWARTRLARADAAYHAHRLRYLVAYVRRHASDRRSAGGSSGQIVGFIAAHLRRRRPDGLSGGRRLAVYLLMAVLCGGSAYDIVTDEEHWPFSQYPMFSWVERQPTLEALRVVGVTREPRPREVPLLDSEWLYPFDQCRLQTAIARTWNNPQRRTLTSAMLADTLGRYEASRRGGAHEGPPLAAVRLYDMTWRLAPDAGNVDAPDAKRLLLEVDAPGTTP